MLAGVGLKISDVVINFGDEGVFDVFSLGVPAFGHEVVVDRYLFNLVLLLVVGGIVFRLGQFQLFLHFAPISRLLLYSLPT